MKARCQQGFTVIELMVGTIAAAVLALTIGSILAYVYKGWIRNMALAEMERDAAVAVHSLDVAVRGSSSVVVAGVDILQVSNTTLRVFTVHNRSTPEGPRRDLIYNGIAVVTNQLGSFVTSNNADSVWVTMSLNGIDKFNKDTGVRMGVTNRCILMRNLQ